MDTEPPRSKRTKPKLAFNKKCDFNKKLAPNKMLASNKMQQTIIGGHSDILFEC